MNTDKNSPDPRCSSHGWIGSKPCPHHSKSTEATPGQFPSDEAMEGFDRKNGAGQSSTPTNIDGTAPTADTLVNSILEASQESLVTLFREKFGEEVESEAMLELIASIQLYAARCMNQALVERTEHGATDPEWEAVPYEFAQSLNVKPKEGSTE